MTITTIGIDLAKSIFQLHGIDTSGDVIFGKNIRRSAVLDTLKDILDLSRFDTGLDRRLSIIKETGLWVRDTAKTFSERPSGLR